MQHATAKRLGPFGLSAVLLALSAGPVLAQPPSAPPVMQAGQSTHISDSQLQSYAKAVVQVQKIAMQGRTALQTAKTGKQRQKVITSVDQRQIRAVKSAGLTVQEYNQISKAGQKNPQIRAKIQKYMKQTGAR